VGLCEAVFEANGLSGRSYFLVDLGDGLLLLEFVSHGVAEFAVGVGVTLLDANGLAVRGDGLLQPALVLQGEAEIEMGLGRILFEAKGLAVLGHGLVQLPLTP